MSRKELQEAMHDITILGPLNLDLVIHGSAPIDVEALVEWSGTTDVTMLMAGAIGYFAGISTSLGRHVEVISTMADDPLAGTITRTLKTFGIDTKHVSVQP
ncbi:hypothetical protein GF325_00990, partial [Candidatus Bathyarchaeota archaeon]|nr:hypothetical protein [Candidatus Bathyarchaeota archaeon]